MIRKDSLRGCFPLQDLFTESALDGHHHELGHTDDLVDDREERGLKCIPNLASARLSPTNSRKLVFNTHYVGFS